MPDLVYNVKFNIEDPSKAGAGKSGAETIVTGYNRAEQAAENFGQEATKAGQAASNAAKKAAKDTASLANAQNQMVAGAKRMNSSFSSTNQLLFSFGDGIQDASQFSYGFATGMRAVGNNIGFTAELFGNLSSKVKEYNTVNAAAIASGQKMAKTMKSELVGSLMGPGGALLAINLVITAITMYSRSQEVARKKTEEAKGAVDDYAKALRQLAEIADPTETVRQGVEQDLKNLPIAIDLAKQLEQAQKDLKETSSDLAAEKRKETSSTLGANISQEDSQEQLAKSRDETEKLIDSLKDQIAQYTDLGVEVTKLEGALANAQKMMSIFRGETKATTEIELGALVDTLRGDVSDSLLLYELGLRDAIPAIDQNLGSLNKLIDLYTQEANAGNTLVIPTLRELIKLRKDLTKEVSPDLGISPKEFADQIGLKTISSGVAQVKQELSDIDYRKLFYPEDFEGEIKRIDVSDFFEMEFISDLGLEAADELNKSFNKKSESLQEESLKRRSEQLKLYYKDLISQAEIAQKSEALILQFTTRESAVARDTVDKINTYYNNKEAQEKQRLLDQGITDERVFSALSLAIEAEKQNELTRLSEQGSKARKSIQDQEYQQMIDLYMRLVTNVSSAIQELFGKNKAVAIAETIINTYFAAQKAAASAAGLFPGASAVAAATEIAAGLARVAQIKKTNIGSESAGGAGGGGGGSFASASTLTGVSGFQVSGEGPSYTPTMYGPRSFRQEAQISVNVDETGFGLYLKGIDGNLQNDTMFVKSA